MEGAAMHAAIYFDMDGTIADLYGFAGWLDLLVREDVTPYSACEPLPLLGAELLESLHALRRAGVRVGVVSWGAKGSSADYLERTRHAKARWLAEHGFPCDELHVVAYGTAKAECAEVRRHSVLVDDDASVRATWAGAEGRAAVEPSECLALVRAMLAAAHEGAR